MTRHKTFWKMRQKSKYKNVFTTVNGNKYHSKFEAKVSQDLDLLVKSGEITHYDRQVKIDLTAHGKHICNYYIDFVAYHSDGRVEYIEVKGFETDVWRIKWALFEAQYGGDINNMLTIIRK